MPDNSKRETVETQPADQPLGEPPGVSFGTEGKKFG